MLTTIEAEIDVNGNVRLLEPLKLKKKSRAIVTVLNETADSPTKTSEKILDFFESPRFVNRKSYSNDEIKERIEELRNC